MMRRFKAEFFRHRYLQPFDFGRKKFDDLAAFGTNYMVYLQLGIRSAHLAERQGANRGKLQKILEKIALAKKNLKC